MRFVNIAQFHNHNCAHNFTTYNSTTTIVPTIPQPTIPQPTIPQPQCGIVGTIVVVELWAQLWIVELWAQLWALLWVVELWAQLWLCNCGHNCGCGIVGTIVVVELWVEELCARLWVLVTPKRRKSGNIFQTRAILLSNTLVLVSEVDSCSEVINYLFKYISSASSNRSTIAKDTQLLPPTLRLVRYKLHDSTKWVRVHVDLENGSSFDEDFISKNGSDYTISEDVSRVLIRCIAKYPIEIVFPFVEHVDSAVYLRMTAERVSEFNEDLDEPMTQSYLLYTYINFFVAKFFSTTLACQSVENKEISSSAHVYKLSLNEIERKGQTIQIAFDSKQNPLQVELPCRPASPTALIVLQKQGEVSIWENGNFSSVPVWNEYKWSKFDPKVGITLTLTESQIYYNSNPDELIGLYKCTLSEGSEDDYVLFNVSRKSVKPDKNVFYPKFKLKGKASFGLLVEKNDSKSFYEKYMCCSGVPSKPPVFIVQNCDSLLECDVKKTRLPIETIENALVQSRSRAGHFNHSSNSNCTTGTVYGVSSILLCRGENIDVSQQFYQTLRMSNENNGSRSWIEKSFCKKNCSV
ncbi:unnamed protein product [Orchesella dallaii]|uniref:Ig-like domain-containing protein n=1 Tax=Orchesella dallaii TaxID=48710 RepID=A0ABP1PME2_9HEXA